MNSLSKVSASSWLVLRFSAMGDVALTTGVLAWWAENRSLRFDFATRAQNAPLIQEHPAVDRVWGFTGQEMGANALAEWVRSEARRFAGWGLLDLHGTLRTRLLAARWKGPVLRYPKFSWERRLFLWSGGRLFGDRLAATTVTQRYAMAMEAVPPPAVDLRPRIYLTEAERLGGRRHLADALGNIVSTEPSTGRAVTDSARTPGDRGCPSRPTVALHPFATHAGKAWPREFWLRLIDLMEEAGIGWVVLGRGEALLEDPRDMTNRTDLRETCAVLAQVDLLVTGDSGPMHLAAGVDTPVVALFGPTTREWGFFPAGADDFVIQADIKCRPCSLHGGKACPAAFACMRAIEPERVFDRVAASLAEQGWGNVAVFSCQGEIKAEP